MQRFLGGKVLKMTWNRDKKSWTGEAVKLSNALACTRFGGEGFKNDLDKTSLNSTKIVSESNDNSF